MKIKICNGLFHSPQAPINFADTAVIAWTWCWEKLKFGMVLPFDCISTCSEFQHKLRSGSAVTAVSSSIFAE